MLKTCPSSKEHQWDWKLNFHQRPLRFRTFVFYNSYSLWKSKSVSKVALKRISLQNNSECLSRKNVATYKVIAFENVLLSYPMTTDFPCPSSCFHKKLIFISNLQSNQASTSNLIYEANCID